MSDQTQDEPGSDPGTSLKSLAKSMAKDAAAQIPDRHLRAQVRTTCYNRMVSVLRVVDDRLAAQRLRHRRMSMTLGAVSALLAAALAVSLMA